MRFVCSEPYREFRGHVFANFKPVTITDRGTLEAIRLISVFKEYVDEPEKNEAPAKAAVLDSNVCPKCGKPLKAQGRHFHIKACRG